MRFLYLFLALAALFVSSIGLTKDASAASQYDTAYQTVDALYIGQTSTQGNVNELLDVTETYLDLINDCSSYSSSYYQQQCQQIDPAGLLTQLGPNSGQYVSQVVTEWQGQFHYSIKYTLCVNIGDAVVQWFPSYVAVSYTNNFQRCYIAYYDTGSWYGQTIAPIDTWTTDTFSEPNSTGSSDLYNYFIQGYPYSYPEDYEGEEIRATPPNIDTGFTYYPDIEYIYDGNNTLIALDTWTQACIPSIEEDNCIRYYQLRVSYNLSSYPNPGEALFEATIPASQQFIYPEMKKPSQYLLCAKYSLSLPIDTPEFRPDVTLGTVCINIDTQYGAIRGNTGNPGECTVVDTIFSCGEFGNPNNPFAGTPFARFNDAFPTFGLTEILYAPIATTTKLLNGQLTCNVQDNIGFHLRIEQFVFLNERLPCVSSQISPFLNAPILGYNGVNLGFTLQQLLHTVIGALVAYRVGIAYLRLLSDSLDPHANDKIKEVKL